MNWHEPTPEEVDGTGDQAFLVDIAPDEVPHQAATDGDALFRIAKPGWAWMIRRERLGRKGNREGWRMMDSGVADTKEAAIGDAMAALGRLRETRWDEQ